jgi:hypothetical protein
MTEYLADGTTRQRPLSVTVIGLLFIGVGALGVGYHAREFWAPGSFRYELIWITGVRLLAVVGGLYLLLGRNWARWLLVAWLAFHVVVSALHSAAEAVMHAVLLVVIGYFLFRPRASAYCRGMKPAPAP